jgi:thymidylate synthase (FAD)
MELRKENTMPETTLTKRATVYEMEDILEKQIDVLDHGFIRVVDYMGDDSAIVQAARVSYGKGTKQISQDRGLIRYLMRHRHTTPFEMCEIKFHVKLPIFVARQWIRHRTANVNEYSARYSILDKEFYVPSPDNLAAQSTMNKQGRDEALEGVEASDALAMITSDSERCYANYIHMLNVNEETGDVVDPSRKGLARELARMNIPTNFYTQWYWKVDLHNLLHFCKLRADSHAQYEIRVYAEEMLKIIKAWVPLTYEAFEDYMKNSFNLSKQMRDALIRMIRGEQVTKETSGLTAREWVELMNYFDME